MIAFRLNPQLEFVSDRVKFFGKMSAGMAVRHPATSEQTGDKKGKMDIVHSLKSEIDC